VQDRRGAAVKGRADGVTGLLRRRGFSVALAVLLSVGAPAAGEPSQADLDRATKPYEDCLSEAAIRIDDGRSEFVVVGRAVAAACEEEWRKMVSGIKQELSTDDLRNFQEPDQGWRNGLGASAVAQLRAKRGQPIITHHP
jgi:hypothetical protein